MDITSSCYASKEYADQTYHASEVHDQSTILERLLNFENHLGLTNEQIIHEDIHSVPLYKESYVLITPKNTFSNSKRYPLNLYRSFYLQKVPKYVSIWMTILTA